MNTLYLTRGTNIAVDTETSKVDRIPTTRIAIDNIYLIDKPTHVIYGCGTYQKEVDAKEGDIVITFYDKVFKHQMIVISNEEWAENIIEYRKEEQREKEEWAAKKLENTNKDE